MDQRQGLCEPANFTFSSLLTSTKKYKERSRETKTNYSLND